MDVKKYSHKKRSIHLIIAFRLLGAATEAIIAPGKVIAVAFLTNPILRERHSCKDGVNGVKWVKFK